MLLIMSHPLFKNYFYTITNGPLVIMRIYSLVFYAFFKLINQFTFARFRIYRFHKFANKKFKIQIFDSKSTKKINLKKYVNFLLKYKGLEFQLISFEFFYIKN